jgi:AcrR family transcriptional regulator
VVSAVAIAAGARVSERDSARAQRTAQLAEIQRARLIAGAVSAIDELGYARTTVEHITARSRVSRRTFYELFANREACLIAVLEHGVEQVRQDLSALGLQQRDWRERVRLGLVALLGFFDSEPALARVCVVQALRGGQRVLERREQILTELAQLLDEGRRQNARGQEHTPLLAEGLVGAASAIVYARLLRREREPLIELQGELMAMIMLPYLGTAVARREQRRTVTPMARSRSLRDVGSEHGAEDPLCGVPMRLTYRTARVLEGVAEHPGASNREIGHYAEIADQGQISKLLARLQRVGLLANHSHGHAKGEANAWRLTDRGELVARSVRLHSPDQRRVA